MANTLITPAAAQFDLGATAPVVAEVVVIPAAAQFDLGATAPTVVIDKDTGVPAVQYILEVRDDSQELVAYLDNGYNIDYTERLNQPYTMSFKLPADDDNIQYLTQVDYEIWIRRYNTGELVRRFRIDIVKPTRSGGFTYYNVECVDMAVLLCMQMVLSFSETTEIRDAIQSILDLQVLTPTITLGTISSGPLEPVPIEITNMTLWQALNKIREISAGYLEVDNDLQLNLKDAYGVSEGQQILYEKNLIDLEVTYDYTSLFNYIYAYGAQIGGNRILVEVEDAASQATYGLRETVLYRDDISTEEDLERAADHYLNAHKAPPVSYQISAIDRSELASKYRAERWQVGSTIKIIDTDLGISDDVVITEINHPDLLSNPSQASLAVTKSLDDNSYLPLKFASQDITDDVADNTTKIADTVRWNPFIMYGEEEDGLTESNIICYLEEDVNGNPMWYMADKDIFASENLLGIRLNEKEFLLWGLVQAEIEGDIGAPIYLDDDGEGTTDRPVFNYGDGVRCVGYKTKENEWLFSPGSFTDYNACFLLDCPIMFFDGRILPLENIQQFDFVQSWDFETGRSMNHHVTDILRHEYDGPMAVVNGWMAVPTHPVWIDGDWKMIGNARVGDNMMNHLGEPVPIRTMEAGRFKGTVGNLKVPRTQCYFATPDNVLVHNK